MPGMDSGRVDTAAGWLERFRSAGHREVTTLAAGAEGSVYRLGDGTVAKVWVRRRRAELLLMQQAYVDIATAGLPFATPVIHIVQEIDGAAVTIEQELPGQPLQAHLEGNAGAVLDDVVVGCLSGILRELSRVPATAALRALPVLDERRPFWDSHRDFPAALIAMLRRRSGQHGPLLRQHIEDYDLRQDRVLARLDALGVVEPRLVHGDLFGGNILVDQGRQPLAVLDFGFFTTAGDPRLDAAITAAIMDMYGPRAADVTFALTARLADELDCPVETLLVYQAAYALATSNAFTDDGSDGHFAWCVRQLARADVSAVLGLRPLSL
jgi:aminoglycoside phosphotransferase (APT) family kinase protein